MGDPVSLGLTLAAAGAQLGSSAGAAALPAALGLSGAAAGPMGLAGAGIGGLLGAGTGYFGGRAAGNLMRPPPQLPEGLLGRSNQLQPVPTSRGIQFPRFDFQTVSPQPQNLWEELRRRGFA